MEPFTWVTVAGLIVKVGIPMTEKLIQLWQAGGPVTLEEWNTAKALGEITPNDILDRALAQVGMSPDDPRAKQIRELMKPPGAPAAPAPPAPPQPA